MQINNRDDQHPKNLGVPLFARRRTVAGVLVAARARVELFKQAATDIFDNNHCASMMRPKSIAPAHKLRKSEARHSGDGEEKREWTPSDNQRRAPCEKNRTRDDEQAPSQRFVATV